MQKTVIKYQNVEVKFGNQEIIKDISFNIYENDFVNIVGPNGAGKTTLIRTLINDIKVNKGNIFIEDVSLGYVPQKQLVKQNFPITVLEFIYMGFNNQKLIIPKEDITKIKEALNDMDLSADILNEKISYLSGGELQRIYLARSLVANPKILILDEPASALDPLFREHFYIFLNKLWKNGTTIINITHDLTDIELHGTKVMYLDRIIKFFGDSKDFKEFEHEGHSHE